MSQRILLLLALTLAPAWAGAQDEAAPTSATTTSSYEVALSEALAAHARGDYAQARIFMERAHALEPSARTLRGLGIVAFAQGRHLEAIRYLDQSLLASEKPLSAELRQSVEELLGHAWGQVGRYELLIDPTTGDFLIDGREPDWYAAHTVVLLPGNHVLTARAPARAPYELTLSVKPGEQRALHIVLAVPPAVVAQGASEPTFAPAQGKPAPRSFWSRKGRWLALASGGALLAGGGALWGVAHRRLQRIVEDCENHVDGTCTPAEATGEYRKQNVAGLGISAGVTLGVGAAALLATGAVELWRRSHRDRSPLARRELALSLGGASLSLHGSF